MPNLCYYEKKMFCDCITVYFTYVLYIPGIYTYVYRTITYIFA